MGSKKTLKELNSRHLKDAELYKDSMKIFRFAMIVMALWNLATLILGILAGDILRATVSGVFTVLMIAGVFFSIKKEAEAAKLVQEAKERDDALHVHR